MNALKKIKDYLDEKFFSGERFANTCAITVTTVFFLYVISQPIDTKQITYTIKITDNTGHIVTLYQNKKVEFKEGFVYVCDPKVYSCVLDEKAIILGGNVIVEPE